MERPCSNDWPIPTVKSFFLIAPWNLQSLLLCLLLHDHFTVCLWGKRGKSLFLQSCYPPIYTAESSSKSPAHTLPWTSLLQAEQTHLAAFPCTLGAPALWTSWHHCPGFAPACYCLFFAGDPKNKTQHSRCGFRNAELRGINEAMPSGFSSGEKGMFLNSAWMNTESERIVFAALVNQKPVNEMLYTRNSPICYCIIVFL